jgi:hypothetical protein
VFYVALFKIGFYSITIAPKRPGFVQVRGRVKEDMEELASLAQEKLGMELDIVTAGGTDYAYRFYVSPGQWAELARLLTVDLLDYSNYKNSVHSDHLRDDAYYDVWRRMNRLQQEKAKLDAG